MRDRQRRNSTCNLPGRQPPWRQAPVRLKRADVRLATFAHARALIGRRQVLRHDPDRADMLDVSGLLRDFLHPLDQRSAPRIQLCVRLWRGFQCSGHGHSLLDSVLLDSVVGPGWDVQQGSRERTLLRETAACDTPTLGDACGGNCIPAENAACRSIAFRLRHNLNLS
jgi:hypothetical protein